MSNITLYDAFPRLNIADLIEGLASHPGWGLSALFPRLNIADLIEGK